MAIYPAEVVRCISLLQIPANHTLKISKLANEHIETGGTSDKKTFRVPLSSAVSKLEKGKIGGYFGNLIVF